MRKVRKLFGLSRGLQSLRCSLNGVNCILNISLAALAAAGAIAPAAVQAADRVIDIELGVGAQYAPEYQGSDSYAVSPMSKFARSQYSLGGLKIGGIGELTGFSLSPSFRFLPERTSDDFPILAGIPDNEAAVELGLQAR